MTQIAVHNLWDTATAVKATGAITSTAIDQRIYTGHAAIRVIITGTTPSVNITMTVSHSDGEGQTYVIPYDTDGNSLGNIVIAGSEITASKWIYFDLPLARYLKITVTGSATNHATDTTVKAYLITQVEV